MQHMHGTTPFLSDFWAIQFVHLILLKKESLADHRPMCEFSYYMYLVKNYPRYSCKLRSHLACKIGHRILSQCIPRWLVRSNCCKLRSKHVLKLGTVLFVNTHLDCHDPTDVNNDPIIVKFLYSKLCHVEL